MKSKYEIFLENVKKLQMESNKRECEMLIELAQNFYSLYQQNTNLARVTRKLGSYYTLVPTDNSENPWRLELVDNQLDMVSRLVLDFYKRIFELEEERKMSNKTFVCHILTYDKDLLVFPKHYQLDIEQVMGKTLKVWIEESIQKACACCKTKKSINLKLDNIKGALRLYKRYKNLLVSPEEICFNNVFSEKYVNMLVDVMNFDETLLCLYIAPIRAQLGDSERGDRDRDSTTWTWCYHKDMRMSLSELISKIQCKKTYDEILCEFDTMSIELDNQFKRISKECE